MLVVLGSSIGLFFFTAGSEVPPFVRILKDYCPIEDINYSSPKFDLWYGALSTEQKSEFDRKGMKLDHLSLFLGNDKFTCYFRKGYRAIVEYCGKDFSREEKDLLIASPVKFKHEHSEKHKGFIACLRSSLNRMPKSFLQAMKKAHEKEEQVEG
jgi:hypothetical protein